jgi:uncharacterized protein
MRKVFIALVRGYQRFVSPLTPSSCRFYPTCSEYAAQAFHKYGVFKGGAKAVWRILRCGPWHPGGFDPLK